MIIYCLGKLKISQIYQQYGRERSAKFEHEKQLLSQNIAFYEQHVNKQSHFLSSYTYSCKVLKELQDKQTKGAQIRSRFQFCNEMDTSSDYFYKIEKRKSMTMNITHLELEDGRYVYDNNSILNHAKIFYKKLYTPEPVEFSAQEILLNGLSQLPRDLNVTCERPLSFDEFSDAVTKMKNNKAPGLDGLPADFYKSFWDTIGHDLFDVFVSSVKTGMLPLSCCRAVITLIPKKGNNGLSKDWRPVSLLCADLKIFTKTIVNCLNIALPFVIGVDQSYCIKN